MRCHAWCLIFVSAGWSPGRAQPIFANFFLFESLLPLDDAHLFCFLKNLYLSVGKIDNIDFPQFSHGTKTLHIGLYLSNHENDFLALLLVGYNYQVPLPWHLKVLENRYRSIDNIDFTDFRFLLEKCVRRVITRKGSTDLRKLFLFDSLLVLNDAHLFCFLKNFW